MPQLHGRVAVAHTHLELVDQVLLRALQAPHLLGPWLSTSVHLQQRRPAEHREEEHDALVQNRKK